MNVVTLASRKRLPRPFIETDNLPWHDPDFSRRALREQLNQSHDSGTRSEPTIKEHVRFMIEQLQLNPGDTVLDLTCGPGLYAKHLSASGCSVIGIDISPAAIEHARLLAIPRCEFILGDVRTTDYPAGVDGILLIYGALNTFSPADAQVVLEKIAKSLKPSRRLVLELYNTSCLYAHDEPTSMIQGWWCSDQGDLWSDGPYVALKERFYYPTEKIEVTRYFIIPEGSQHIEEYTETCVNYDIPSITKKLHQAGLHIEAVCSSMLPGLANQNVALNGMSQVIIASKPAVSKNAVNGKIMG